MNAPSPEPEVRKTRNFLSDLLNRPYREESHSEMIRRFLVEHVVFTDEPAVLVELGAGLTTTVLAEIAAEKKAIFYSCDNNEKKIEDIRKKHTSNVDHVVFMAGDSLQSLRHISSRHPKIQFVFFDSAPSAMHTFREFQIVEMHLTSGSCILIDNAALPEEKCGLLSPCRKGKILVPYLLASPHWHVSGHPHAGDSMVSAVYCNEPNHAHPDYERCEQIDYWSYEQQE